MTLHRLLFTCLTLLGVQMAAQHPALQPIGVEQGLPQGFVTCIAQDKEGFIWMGTPTGGLSRYDGYRFWNCSSNPFDPNSYPGILFIPSPIWMTTSLPVRCGMAPTCTTKKQGVSFACHSSPILLPPPNRLLKIERACRGLPPRYWPRVQMDPCGCGHTATRLAPFG
ncbi:MAG: hypothetical protein IPK21_09835 [Haliscomenobacter sp.]|nr:hypothetical protein [Haliscomenobacter sp.]